MKLILIGLTIICWILWFPAYTQTEQKPEVFCVPIEKARLLVADALRLRVADSLNNLQAGRIALLESQYESSYQSFTNLLKIEQDKFKEQSLIISDLQKHSQSFADQLVYIQKREKKQRIQNRVLKVGITLAAGFIVYQSVK